jgi:hypothetical protein
MIATGPSEPLEPEKPEKARSRLWLRLSLAALVVLAASAWEEIWFWRPPLTFRVGGSQSGVLGDWESAPETEPLILRFSDGTSLQLEPGARARVLTLGRAGAEIAIDSGTARVAVAPTARPVFWGSAWRLSTGPFSLEVTSARFEISWDPRADDFTLEVFEDEVRLSGCERAQTVVAGQAVHASCRRNQWASGSALDPAKAAPEPASALPPPE